MNDLEIKRRKIETLVKVAALPLIGLIVAPFTLYIFHGLLGALGLLMGGGFSLVAINMAPWFAAKVANWRLKLLKMEAAKNPIETLENAYAAKQQALLNIRENIRQSYSVLQGLHDQIREHTEKYPNRPSQYIEKYSKLRALIELRGKKYKQAQENLATFADVIEEKRSDWKIAQTMAKASELANVGEDFQSKLMQDTALSSVQDGLNLAFSELETSLLDEQPPSGGANATVVTISPPNCKSLPDKLAPLDLGFDVEAEAEPELAPKRRRA